MLAAVVAALAVASQALSLDVPFVSQTDALCGGAAAAMVFRFWGAAHADPQQFAPLIERPPGKPAGIADTVLVRAIAERGWRTDSSVDSLTSLRARIDARQPVIVLLADKRSGYHYVVVVGVGVNDREIVVHDPSWGPSRRFDRDEFSQLWAATKHWSLVVLPDGGVRPAATVTDQSSEAPAPRADSCDASTALAIAQVRSQGLASADEILGPLRAACPDSPAPYRELAGVRFAQHRWTDAAALARQALDRQRDDAYALDVLGASLFMQDDPVGALRAWNRIGKPTLDLVRIEGLRHARYQTIAESLALSTNTLLTADRFLQAKHRLEELPDRASDRLTVRPATDGFATLDVAIAERTGWPRGWPEWTGVAVRAAVDRELAMVVPGATGQGETWSASWRWWSDRPRVAVGFAAPRVAGLPGVWRVDGSWEAETYAADGFSTVRQSRAHGGLTVSDWLSGSVRYELRSGIESLQAGGFGFRAAFVGGALERRWLDDRLAAGFDLQSWLPFADSQSFNSASVRAHWSSSASPPAPGRWRYEATAGASRVSDAAPPIVWPGAGEGRARPMLLRAHPLLDGGVIDASPGSAFGRSLRYATGEAQRWLTKPQLPRLAIAAFVDVARASRQLVNAPAAMQVDVGGGLRVRLPGVGQTLRIDVAYGLRDRANAVTVGWIF